MEIEIKPIQGFGKTAVAIELGAFQVDVQARTAKARWILRDSNGGELAQGATELNGEDYAKWGTDDKYVIDFVVSSVLVELTPEEDERVGRFTARNAESAEVINGN